MTGNILSEYGNSPMALFQKWFAEAEKSEPNDPEAMALATMDKDGRPEIRIVLMKSADEKGFAFHTNRQSAKGEALSLHPYAALNFYWKSLRKQIRISGPVEAIPDAESDAYFATRSRASRLAACASDQSRSMNSYEDFKNRVAEMEKKFPGKDIPRPAHWGGYRVIPERMEFWIAHPDRMHKRFVYIKNGKNWTASWLFP